MNVDKNKRIWVIVLSAFLYIAGVTSILYPMISNIVSLQSAETVISSYEKNVKEIEEKDLSEIFQRADNYNKCVAEKNYDEDDRKCLDMGDGLMCYLEIPSISVYLPVYYGTSKEVLQKGCGHLDNTSLPVGGKSTHSVISGHTGLPSAQMLTDLDRVKKNEVFYIHVLDRVLAYRVDLIRVVEPTDVSSLFIEEGEDMVTLLTCTPYGINDHRLLVRGVRTDYTPKNEESTVSGEPVKTSNDNDVQNNMSEAVLSEITNIVIIISVAAVVFIAAVVWLVIDIRKRKDNTENSNNSDSE